MLEEVAARIASLRREHPLRVAVDGPDAAGKTTFADALRPLVESRGRPVVRVSIDDFHNPRDERYRRGELSPEGYYLDSFDHDAFRAQVLAPTGADAVVLVDGVFLLRPELRDLWDFSVFLRLPLEESIRRGARRDAELLGSEEAALRRYEQRYGPGQRIYFERVRPWELADVVVDASSPT